LTRATARFRPFVSNVVDDAIVDAVAHTLSMMLPSYIDSLNKYPLTLQSRISCETIRNRREGVNRERRILSLSGPLRDGSRRNNVPARLSHSDVKARSADRWIVPVA